MPPATPTNQTDASAKRSFTGKLMRILLILLLVAAIIGGGIIFLLLQKKNDLPTPLAAEPEPAAQAALQLDHPPSFLSLDPFVVNLMPEDGERYLQVIMALRVPDQKTVNNLTMFVPEIRHRINLRLAGKLPSEISGPLGHEQLAEEIRRDVNETLAPAFDNPQIVQAVLFNSFIIQ